MLMDLKTALRQLTRAPGTTLAAVLTLAVGIGSTTATFSFLAAVMSSSTPVSDMDRRVALWSHNRSEAETKNSVSLGDFVEWRRRATLVDQITARRSASVNLGGIDTPVRASTQQVSPNYFEFFRWTPMLGRTFIPADGTPGAPRVVVLSYEFWQRAMASRVDVVGSPVRLDGEPATIVGVLPRMPAVDGIYVPLVIDPARLDRAARVLFVFARLGDGVSIEQARTEMEAIGQALEREFPNTNRGWSVNTRPLQEEFIGPQARLAFAILIATVMSVLLIGCVNIANLLLARGLARRGEMAVRLALGAGGWRVARQLFVECGLVAAAGVVASLPVSRWTLQIYVTTFPIDSPWVDSQGLNPRAIALAMAAAAVATLASGLAPALAARSTDLVSGLHASGRSGARTDRRLTGTLVAAEIALAVVLLVVSGLLMRTLIAIERLDPGFEVSNLLTASIALPLRMTDADAARWFDQALARTRSIPGVLEAGATSRLPFAGSRFNPNRGLEIDGRVPSPGTEGTWAVDYIVTPRFFESLRMRLIDGRTFVDGDGAGAPLVAVVNQAMARRFWPDRSPLGARLRQGDDPPGPWRTVVGIVADVRNDDADNPPPPYLYVPLAQRPARAMALALRTAGDPRTLVAPLRNAVAEFDADQALYDIRTMDDVLREDLQGSRVLIQVFGAFALIALALAGIGIWGVTAHAVGQRTREIGVRVALGASTGQVTGLIAWQGLKPVAAGLAVGLVGGLAVARVMRSILFQTSPADPITLAGTIAMLGAVGLIATLIPALRAARLDPLTALRES